MDVMDRLHLCFSLSIFFLASAGVVDGDGDGRHVLTIICLTSNHESSTMNAANTHFYAIVCQRPRHEQCVGDSIIS